MQRENFTFLIGYGIPAETFLISFSIEFQNGAPFENYRGRLRMERLLNRLVQGSQVIIIEDNYA